MKTSLSIHSRFGANSIVRRISATSVALILVALLGLATMSCGEGTVRTTGPAEPPAPPTVSAWPLTDAQVATLLAQKMFFGHQSVGGNVVQGIHDLMATDGRLKLKMVSSSHPDWVAGPAFIDSLIGQNGDPALKDAAFASIVDNGLGAQAAIAMYKYCWVDMTDSTDPQQMFSRYRNNVDTLQARYPALKIIHITVPLTVDADSSNVRRNEYDRLLRQAYSASIIFDLAEAESTHADGSRSSAVVNGQTIYTLAAEYTYDGGHLNPVGRQVAAKRMLITLANL